jgi:putative membrane protein
MMYWYDHDMGWWGYAGVGVVMVLFWGFLIVGFIALIRFTSADRKNPQPSPLAAQAPEEILAARFARGEISETEYRDRLTILREPAAMTRLSGD